LAALQVHAVTLRTGGSSYGSPKRVLLARVGRPPVALFVYLRPRRLDRTCGHFAAGPLFKHGQRADRAGGGLLRNKATRAVIVFIGDARPIVTAQRGVRSRSCVGEEPNWDEKLLYISALVRFARVSSGTNTPVKGLNSDLRLMERRICTQIKEQDK
jgi:hypothetical protein